MPFNSPADGHPDIDVSEEDMRLIAAAPEMAELLKGAVPIAEQLGCMLSQGEMSWPGQWLKEACALLAKINGEADD